MAYPLKPLSGAGKTVPGVPAMVDLDEEGDSQCKSTPRGKAGLFARYYRLSARPASRAPVSCAWKLIAVAAFLSLLLLPMLLFVSAISLSQLIQLARTGRLSRHPAPDTCPALEDALTGAEPCVPTPGLLLKAVLARADDVAQLMGVRRRDRHPGVMRRGGGAGGSEAAAAAHAAADASAELRAPARSASVAVLYALSEAPGSPDLQAINTNNFLYFLHHVLATGPDPKMHLYVSASGAFGPELRRALDAIAPLPFVSVLQRENYGFDACAHAEALDAIEAASAPAGGHAFQYFVFLNASVRGPFLPVYYSSFRTASGLSPRWYDIFLSQLTAETKLAGPYLNCKTQPHIQSMAYATDAEGLALLRPAFICSPDKEEVIQNYEINLSRVMLGAGYNIASFLSVYKSVEWDPNLHCNDDVNPTIAKGLFTLSVSPHETVFFKYGGDIARQGLGDANAGATADLLTCMAVCGAGAA